MLNQRKIRQLKKYFLCQPVDLVYLFGSQAEKRATELSDFDFGILFQKGLSKAKRLDLRLEMMVRLGQILPQKKIDLVDLEQAPLKLKYQIIFPKFVIMVKNRRRMIELEKDIIKRYLDFKTYLYPIARRQIELLALEGF